MIMIMNDNEESGKFISAKECQDDQTVTLAFHSFTTPQIIMFCLTETVATDKKVALRIFLSDF